MVTEIKKGLYWVGCVDWGLRHFHGHELSTHRGSTYNAYLLIESHFAQCKIPLVREGIRCKWQPTVEDFQAARAFGRELGQATRKE